LAVVRGGATLVVGELHPDAEREAVAAAGRHGARLVHAPAEPSVAVAAPGSFQRANFALAAAAAEAFRGELGPGAPRAASAAGGGGGGGGRRRVDLPRGRPDPSRRRAPRLDAVNEEEPRFLPMIGLVALVVAVVILVFFGIGYLFGRLFL